LRFDALRWHYLQRIAIQQLSDGTGGIGAIRQNG
jgi:hypothetical protein